MLVADDADDYYDGRAGGYKPVRVTNSKPASGNGTNGSAAAPTCIKMSINRRISLGRLRVLFNDWSPGCQLICVHFDYYLT
jgi:hypothetical protein